MMVLEIVGGKRNIDIGESQSSEIFLPNCMYESEEVSSLHGVITDETEETIKKDGYGGFVVCSNQSIR